jgi:hypothetical protein
VALDPNCKSFSLTDYTVCTDCNAGFYLLSNKCINQPPGIDYIEKEVIYCLPTYVKSGNHCYKNTSLLSYMSA